jgi:CheY-like chemotaxis protein
MSIPPTSATLGKVLVVDDHPINRLLMDAMLTKAGWACVCAESAAQAMQVLSSGMTFDAIFMDIRMPDVDGYAATKMIRQWQLSGQRLRIPILALTADALDESRARALEEGMDGYLTKPVSMERLSEALNMVIAAPKSDLL